MKIDPEKHIPILEAGKDYNEGRTVYVYKRDIENWKELKRNYTSDYYLTSIYRAVYSLNAGCGSTQPRINMHNLKSIEVDGEIVIEFWVLSCGDVLINKLDLKKNPLSKGPQATGLYNATYFERQKEWRAVEKVTTMELNHRWGESFHYAAVSGKFTDKEEAASKLSSHIFRAFNVKKQLARKEGNHFSLFWQNGGFKSKDNVNELVSLIQQTLDQNQSVAWLVHGEGAQTFVKAMEVLKNYPSLTRAEAAQDNLVSQLREAAYNQRVHFSNPKSFFMTEAKLKKLCKKVGFELSGITMNPHDMTMARNYGSPLLKGTTSIAIGGIAGIESATGWGNIESWKQALANADGPAAAIGIAVFGTLIAVNVATTNGQYFRNLPETWKSTFGKGNQEWTGK